MKLKHGVGLSVLAPIIATATVLVPAAHVSAEQYCYILIGGTYCSDVPDEGKAQREKEYLEWVQENLDQSGVVVVLPDGSETGLPILPETSIVIPIGEIKTITHEPTVVEPVSDIGTPPLPVSESISLATATEQAVRENILVGTIETPTLVGAIMLPETK